MEISLLYVLDLFGTFIFAVAGAIIGVKKHLDLFGVMIVGFVTAVGGGTVRDVILGAKPVFWLMDINYFFCITIGGVLTFIIGSRITKLNMLLLVSDAIGIGVFTLIGLKKGLKYNLYPVFAIMMGVTTAIAGGIIRDILCGEVPFVLRKEIYATACIAGGIIYFLADASHAVEALSAGLTIGSIILIRLLSVRMDLSLPKSGTISRHE